jgi:hypothetical protein
MREQPRQECDAHVVRPACQATRRLCSTRGLSSSAFFVSGHYLCPFVGGQWLVRQAYGRHDTDEDSRPT